jgi:hypothetical protein
MNDTALDPALPPTYIYMRYLMDAASDKTNHHFLS